jgi:cytochrome c biogenesis protein CcdA
VIELPITLSLGFILGLEHALDADHVIAISTIISENKSLKKSSIIGVFWGLGHTFTLLFTGLLVLSLAVSIPQNLSLFFEFLVGIVLLILGIWVIRRALGKVGHIHPHSHNDKIHVHFHNHELDNHNHEHKSFFVGMVHGLAGSAALMLIVLSSINSVLEGIAYILVFGLGSILGMLIISTLIGLPFTFTSTRFKGLNQKIKLITGFLSIVLGFLITYKVIVIEELWL